MKTLLILNDPPYGTERSFNGLRLAKALVGKGGAEVALFLMADAVACAKAGQKVPPGYYILELMVKSVARRGEVLLCGTCMDARGLTDAELVAGPPADPLLRAVPRLPLGTWRRGCGTIPRAGRGQTLREREIWGASGGVFAVK